MNDREIKRILVGSYGKYSMIKNYKNIRNREEALRSCWLATMGMGETWSILFNK